MDLQGRALAVCHITSAALEWLVVRAAGRLRLASCGFLKSPLHLVQVGNRVIVNQENVLLCKRLFTYSALKRSRWIQELLHGKVGALSEW